MVRNNLKRYIKESVRRIINEFMQNGFSFEEMSSLEGEERINYCIKYLGDPIGTGSSRMTFEIDDAQVLKIAYGKHYKAGCAQNTAEYEISQHIKSPILVKTLYHADDFSWIISERVLPCEELDFYKIMGLPYEGGKPEEKVSNNYQNKNSDLLGYDEYKKDALNPNNKYLSFTSVRNAMLFLMRGKLNPQQYPNEYEMIQNHPWFKELYKLAKYHDLDLEDVGGANMGITLRNGKPSIVILDSGLTKEVWDKYY